MEDHGPQRLEEVFELALKNGRAVHVTLPAKTYAGCEMVALEWESGLLICRGGVGFTAEDHHYIRIESVQAVSVRIPSASPATDRVSPAIRDSLRQAAGYPLSLAARPGVLREHPDAFAAWLTAIVRAVSEICSIEPRREAFQAAVDQILLREGSRPAILGGSTLILEAAPETLPTTEQSHSAIDAIF